MRAFCYRPLTVLLWTFIKWLSVSSYWSETYSNMWLHCGGLTNDRILVYLIGSDVAHSFGGQGHIFHQPFLPFVSPVRLQIPLLNLLDLSAFLPDLYRIKYESRRGLFQTSGRLFLVQTLLDFTWIDFTKWGP